MSALDVRLGSMKQISDTTLRGRRLLLARAVWVLLALVTIGAHLAGVGSRYEEMSTTCSTEDCVVMALSPAEEEALLNLGLTMHIYGVFQVGLELVLVTLLTALALLIFWKRSSDWMGLLVSMTLVLFGGNFLSESDGALARRYTEIQPLLDVMSLVTVVFVVSLFYLFPDGKFVPRWSRLLVVFLIVSAIIDRLLIQSDAVPSGQLTILITIALLICLVGGVYAQVYRYRQVSGPLQKQQMKWVMLGLVSIVPPIFWWSLTIEGPVFEPGPARLYNTLIGMSTIGSMLALFPISIALSIMRYRLWDIDVLINRALVYVASTGSLAVVYFASVVALQAVFRAITGQESGLAVVVSTLVIAALFVPLRGRIQALIDRRFYRSRYDAEQTLAAFSIRARDEVDIERLSGALVGVVEDTMRPAHASLWLRKS